MPISREKEDRMWRRANKMADSGEYSGWWPIEVELRQQGFSRARMLLDDEHIRERLDSRCAKAQGAKRDA